MASIEETLNNGNQSITNRDTANIFVWNNRSVRATYTASGDTTLVAGTLMGRITATGLIVECDTAASDGSEYPLGYLMNDHVIADGESKEVEVVTAGDVVEDLTTLTYGNTYSDDVNGRQLRDWVTDRGIHLVGNNELSGYDNQ